MALACVSKASYAISGSDSYRILHVQISVLLATAEPFLVCAVAVISSLCRRTCRTKPILLLVLDQGFCSLFGEWCTSFTVLVQADQRQNRLSVVDLAT